MKACFSVYTGIYQYKPVYTGTYQNNDFHPGGQDSRWYVLLRSTTRAQSQMKMLRRVQNEMFTFEFDSETALVGSTLER